MEKPLSKTEVRQWLMAFRADPARAFADVPHDIYRVLRFRYLYANNEITDEGDAYLRLIHENTDMAVVA